MRKKQVRVEGKAARFRRVRAFTLRLSYPAAGTFPCKKMDEVMKYPDDKNYFTILRKPCALYGSY